MKKLLLSAVASALLTSTVYAGGDISPVEPKITIPELKADAPFVNLGLYTVGLKVGTLGLGIDASMPLSKFTDAPLAKHFNVRANINGLKYSRDITSYIQKFTNNFSTFGDTATGTLNLFTAGLLLDYYPFEQAQFRLSAGVYYNANKITVAGSTTRNTTQDIANNISLQVNGTATTSGDLTFNKTSPYIGMGWGNRGAEAGWSWSLDIGAMYHGIPTVNARVDSLTGNATVTDNNKNTTNKYNSTQLPSFNKEFASAVDTVNTEIKNNSNVKYTKWYPVIAIGVTYSF